ncbi:hypothetical protein LZ30DRAFT_694460 [Colletotrichum cereale]|nr:hypothetical protein LZ30DRAFT_694460 [Colletotrichum cereale]
MSLASAAIRPNSENLGAAHAKPGKLNVDVFVWDLRSSGRLLLLRCCCTCEILCQDCAPAVPPSTTLQGRRLHFRSTSRGLTERPRAINGCGSMRKLIVHANTRNGLPSVVPQEHGWTGDSSITTQFAAQHARDGSDFERRQGKRCEVRKRQPSPTRDRLQRSLPGLIAGAFV